MSADPMIDWFLVERYLAGDATPAERVEVERWIAADAARRHVVARIGAALQARRRRESRHWNRTEAIDAVMARVRAGGSEPATVPAPRRPRVEAGPTADRLLQLVRQWFEGATELAAAMLLDVNESPLTADEVTLLRDRIDDIKRGTREPPE